MPFFQCKIRNFCRFFKEKKPKLPFFQNQLVLESESLLLNVPMTSNSHIEGNGTYNFVLYSEDNSAINADNDWLFGLRLKAKASAGKGKYALSFSNIIAADASGLETRIADCDVDLTVMIPVSQVTVTPSTASIIMGESLQLTASVFPSDADQGIAWESENPDIASVDADGTVSALASGSTLIKATATDGSGVYGVCTVTVLDAKVSSITLSKTELSMTEGDTETLTATIAPENATNKSVTWTSSDEAVATVSADGLVTAIKAGSAIITAASSNGKTATCEVTVLPILVESLTINPATWSGVEGSEFTINATVLPENAADKTVTFESSDTSVATVDAEGNVKVLKEGSCVITVSTVDGSDLKAECVITGLSGVDAIFADPNALVDVYDMNGVILKKGGSREELKQLKPAIYSLRSADTVVKAIVR